MAQILPHVPILFGAGLRQTDYARPNTTCYGPDPNALFPVKWTIPPTEKQSYGFNSEVFVDFESDLLPHETEQALHRAAAYNRLGGRVLHAPYSMREILMIIEHSFCRQAGGELGTARHRGLTAHCPKIDNDALPVGIAARYVMISRPTDLTHCHYYFYITKDVRLLVQQPAWGLFSPLECSHIYWEMADCLEFTNYTGSPVYEVYTKERRKRTPSEQCGYTQTPLLSEEPVVPDEIWHGGWPVKFEMQFTAPLEGSFLERDLMLSPGSELPSLEGFYAASTPEHETDLLQRLRPEMGVPESGNVDKSREK